MFLLVGMQWSSYIEDRIIDGGNYAMLARCAPTTPGTYTDFIIMHLRNYGSQSV